ncbi:MAG: tetratricopeptide repeat protein [Deltaproteobacteria bacterium]|nr:MAG: tetratricopeptide repeat protein [Deltaproteobacteria bacterium]
MSSADEPCCDAPDPHWESREVVGRFADALVCKSCRRTLKLEDWAISLDLPQPERCTNCGGRLDRVPYSGPPDPAAKCNDCGLSVADAKKLHKRLVRLHPTGDYLEAAKACRDLGRLVLAFKLATAQIAYRSDTIEARELRLQALEGLGLIEPALVEAKDWIDRGAPASVFSITAGLEAARGNLDGTLDVLRLGLSTDPQNTRLWTDYAEILAHFDEREDALEAASYGLSSPEYRNRALDVVALIAETYESEDKLQQAVAAVQRAGKFKKRSVRIAWLTARIAARLHQWEEAKAWLRVTLELDPSHREARLALQRLVPEVEPKPSNGGGWLGWMRRSKDG